MCSLVYNFNTISKGIFVGRMGKDDDTITSVLKVLRKMFGNIGSYLIVTYLIILFCAVLAAIVLSI